MDQTLPLLIWQLLGRWNWSLLGRLMPCIGHQSGDLLTQFSQILIVAARRALAVVATWRAPGSVGARRVLGSVTAQRVLGVFTAQRALGTVKLDLEYCIPLQVEECYTFCASVDARRALGECSVW